MFQDWASANHVQAEMTEVSCTEAESFQMLEEGKLDAFISLDAYGGLYTVIPAVRIGSSDYYFGVSKDRPDLLEELNPQQPEIEASKN